MLKQDKNNRGNDTRKERSLPARPLVLDVIDMLGSAKRGVAVGALGLALIAGTQCRMTDDKNKKENDNNSSLSSQKLSQHRQP